MAGQRSAHASSSRNNGGSRVHLESDDEDDIDDSQIQRRKGNGNGNARAGPSGTATARRNGASKGHVSSDEDDGDAAGDNAEDLEEEEWTVDTFKSRPITRVPKFMAAFSKMIDQLGDMIKKIEDGMEKSKEIAKAIEEARKDDKLVEEINAGYIQSLEQRALLRIRIEVMKQLVQDLRQGKELVNADETFRAAVAERETAWNKKSQRAKFKNDEDFRLFREELWEINHSAACPAVSKWLESGDQEGEEDESDDEDFEMGGTAMTWKCPITLTLLQDAHKSKKCGHVFSGEAILGLIRQAGTRRDASTKCPTAGCNVKIYKEDLVPDRATQQRADEFARRQAMREDTGDVTMAMSEAGDDIEDDDD